MDGCTAGVDWGSTNLRAVLFDAAGRMLDRCERPGAGMRGLDRAAYPDILRGALEPWLPRLRRVLLSGMVTSRDGWVETPYLACPADLSALARHGRRHDLEGIELVFLPGLAMHGPWPDVMRGEEVQLAGLDPAGPSPRTVVLPGTHAKWVALDGGTVIRFRTAMTGELFDLLLNHSLAGRFASAGPGDDGAFARAVRIGHAEGAVLSGAFSARAGVLLGRMDGASVADHLSGLLIGAEIRENGPASLGAGPVVLIGEATLCARYRRAMELLGIETRIAGVSAVDGFRRLAGLMAGQEERGEA